MEWVDLENLVVTVVVFGLLALILFRSVSSGEMPVSVGIKFGGLIIFAFILAFILIRLYKRGIKKQAEAHEEWFEVEKK